MAKETTIINKTLGLNILKVLGEGGQAKVYLVQKPEMEPLALKCLRGDPDTQKYQRFHREIESLKKIEHPGIIRYVDSGTVEDEGFHYYLMEYVEGAKSLQKIVPAPENPFIGNAQGAFDIYVQLLEALDACHAARVVHRDLSLGNVLITPTNRIKIIDFGCCYVHEGRLITLTDEAVGTPAYRAPECGNFSTESVSIRADLYSVGKILWSLVSGQIAFEREAPVFNELALDRVLPDHAMTWHFHHVFERTIRHDPAERFRFPEMALKHAEWVKHLISKEYPPLENLDPALSLCPVCGAGTLVNPGSWVDKARGTPVIDDLRASLNETCPMWQQYTMCELCGFMALFLKPVRTRELKRRKTLQ